jgi:hypothetical protein
MAPKWKAEIIFRLARTGASISGSHIQICGTGKILGSQRSDALYQGTTLKAAEKLALPEGYGLQAVHNYCGMNPALAAEGRYSSRNLTFSAAFLVGP